MRTATSKLPTSLARWTDSPRPRATNPSGVACGRLAKAMPEQDQVLSPLPALETAELLLRQG